MVPGTLAHSFQAINLISPRMTSELKLGTALVTGRTKALRLVKRVAKAIDATPADLSLAEIIVLCTQHTHARCTLPGYMTISLDQFTGGYLWQFWLTIAGPRWSFEIIRDRHQVRFLAMEYYIIFLFRLASIWTTN